MIDELEELKRIQNMDSDETFDRTTDSLEALSEAIVTALEHQEDMLGSATVGKAITATLYVSPDGTGADGLSWRTAFQTINDALDAASLDANDMTLILIAPNNRDTYYDIDLPGVPEWSANVRLQGTMRNFCQIRNTHATADAIMRLTGLAVLSDIGFNLHTTNDNGVILTNGGSRVQRCQFDGTLLTGEAVALWFYGAVEVGAKVDDVDFIGHVTHMRALQVDGFSRSFFRNINIHQCLIGIRIQNASDYNLFEHIDIGDSALGIDIDAGNEQHFFDINFHHNDRNIDDEVGDSLFQDMHGDFPVYLYPDNFTGLIANTNAAGDTWGVDTVIIAAGAIDNPFRVVAIQAEGSAVEKFRIRFSADSGATHYDDIQIEGAVNEVKREVSVFPSQSVPVYNRGTRISCSTKSETGGNNAWVWVEIQEI